MARMSVKRLKETYGYWGQHPRYTLEAWRSEIAADETRLGYWQWIFHIITNKEEGGQS